MNQVDKQYLELVEHILHNGIEKSDRTGTGTKSIFDYTMRFNMRDGFPLLTSKRVYFKGVAHELLWFLAGSTNIKYLVENNVNIWNGDAHKKYMSYKDYKGSICELQMMYQKYGEITVERFAELILEDEKFCRICGELGPVYGAQWRRWENPVVCDIEGWFEEPFDQIKMLINDLKNNPDSRRLMVTAWNVADLPNMTLPPCHYGFQCYTRLLTLEERVKTWTSSLGKSIHYGDDMTHEKLDTLRIPRRTISLKWTQRSVDVGLGLPFNIASYGLLLQLLANEVNMLPEDLIFSGGDCHIYLNHIQPIKEQLRNETFDLPKIEISNKNLFDIKYDDIKLIDYKCSKAVKMDLSN
jgi:thymidylate synthase